MVRDDSRMAEKYNSDVSTRFQVDQDLIVLSNVLGFPLDPSQSPDYSPSVTAPGLSAKAVYDCTVPYRLKETL